MFICTFTKTNATLQFPLTTSRETSLLVHALFGILTVIVEMSSNVVSCTDVYIVDLCLTASVQPAIIPVRSRNDSEVGWSHKLYLRKVKERWPQLVQA